MSAVVKLSVGRAGAAGENVRYGGFMTNWIVGHTDMFKATVTLRSVVNFISDEGTRDGAYGHKRDFQGDLFEKFDMYWGRSPLKYARNVKTPTLILHSDNDFRVPLKQGEQWFRALKHYGVMTELVLFPRENHNLTRTGEPKHLVESLNWQVTGSIVSLTATPQPCRRMRVRPRHFHMIAETECNRARAYHDSDSAVCSITSQPAG